MEFNHLWWGGHKGILLCLQQLLKNYTKYRDMTQLDYFSVYSMLFLQLSNTVKITTIFVTRTTMWKCEWDDDYKIPLNPTHWHQCLRLILNAILKKKIHSSMHVHLVSNFDYSFTLITGTRWSNVSSQEVVNKLIHGEAGVLVLLLYRTHYYFSNIHF